MLDDGNGPRLPILMAQDDVRFMAYWGFDTYFRDWKIVIEQARALVGPQGVVILGGHSQGTSWASLFAAYDFDPDPANVVAGHSLGYEMKGTLSCSRKRPSSSGSSPCFSLIQVFTIPRSKRSLSVHVARTCR